MAAAENRPDEAQGDDLIPIPATLPPNLLLMIGYPASARYIGLCYMGSKATWSDGIASATFPYYSVYEPLINHPAIALQIGKLHLGSDDAYPTHMLLCDREERTLSAGKFEVVKRILTSQFTAKPSEELLAQYESIFQRPESVEEMQALGLFDLILTPSDEMRRETENLLAWLDQFITRELIEQYVELLQAGDQRAWLPLNYINNRFGAGTRARAHAGTEA